MCGRWKGPREDRTRHLVRKRGQLLAHIQNMRAQYNLPAFTRRLAYPAHRDGISARVTDPSVRKRIDVDLAGDTTFIVDFRTA